MESLMKFCIKMTSLCGVLVLAACSPGGKTTITHGKPLSENVVALYDCSSVADAEAKASLDKAHAIYATHHKEMIAHQENIKTLRASGNVTQEDVIQTNERTAFLKNKLEKNLAGTGCSFKGLTHGQVKNYDRLVKT